MQNGTFLVLLRPIFGEKLKTAPPPKEIGCRSCVVHVVIRPEKALEFPIWLENESQFRWRPYFFFFSVTTCFWAEKTLEFPILAGKWVSISVKTFFFGDHLFLGWKTVWISDFGRKMSLNFGEDFFFFGDHLFLGWQTFEFPSFPRNSVWIFGQTVWFWFKSNENSGQGRLHFSYSFKKAPLFQILATRLVPSPPSRRVARIWKRGGLFWKSEKCANDLDSNFHWP